MKLSPPVRVLFLLVVVSAVDSLGGRAEGKTWKVNPEGTGDTPTIQGAIDIAAPGDTVLLGPGTYQEHLVIQGKGLLLRGEAGPGTVILEGAFSGRILTVMSPDLPVVLENLDFQHGRMDGAEINNMGGGVASFATQLVVRDCAFRTNIASSLGGGIYVNSLDFAPSPRISPTALPSALEVSRTVFESNFSGGDGGGVFSDEVPTLLEDCTFRENEAGGTGGGAGFLHQSHLVLRCVFDRNSALLGGGIAFSGNGILRVEETLLQKNFADNKGGGLHVITAGGVELVRSWFVENHTGYYGGGAYFRFAPVTAERVLWLGNAAEVWGGGFYLEGASAGFEFTTWLDNQAPHGASFTLVSADFSVDRSILGDPAADAGECDGTTVAGSCLAGAPTTGICLGMPISARVTVEACAAALDSLCPVPILPGCGAVGHAVAACGPGCTTEVHPLTWGRLKDLYR